MGLRQDTDEGLSYPVYIVQKHVSSKSLHKDPGSALACLGYKPT